MKEQFVTQNILEKLYKLDFSEECLWYWSKIDETTWELNEYIVEDCIDYVGAPLWQQVIDWFRKKELFINISKTNEVTISTLNKSFGYVLVEDLNKDRYSLKMNNAICPHLNYIPANDSKHLLFYKGSSSFILKFPSYEKAREQAILKAIELIENK